MSHKVALSGASGFIGAELSRVLNQADNAIITLGRSAANQVLDVSSLPSIEALDLADIDVVIHLAGLAHDISNDAQTAYQRYDLANHLATRKLAEKAKADGVKQFIFISTAKVLGAFTSDKAFSVDSAYQVESAYTQSKMNAELAIQEVLQGSDCVYTIIRPSLVYDVDAKGNFANLLKLCASSLPIPLARANAPRQMLSRETLVEFIVACIDNPKTKNQIYNVADKQALSTREIVSALREGMSGTPNLLPIPAFVMKLVMTVIQKPQWYEQLFQPFLVDISHAESLMSFNDKGGYASLVEIGKKYKEGLAI